MDSLKPRFAVMKLDFFLIVNTKCRQYHDLIVMTDLD